MDIANCCMNCLQDMKGYAVCLHCGWIEGSSATAANQLPPRAVLADRYVLGTSLNCTRSVITYRGWDVQTDCPVIVREYFPVDHVIRTPDSPAVLPKTPEDRVRFRQHLARVKKAAGRMTRICSQPPFLPLKACLVLHGTLYLITGYIAGQSLPEYWRQDSAAWPVDDAVRAIRNIGQALKACRRKRLAWPGFGPQAAIITRNREIMLADPSWLIESAAPNRLTAPGRRYRGFCAPEADQPGWYRPSRAEIYTLGAILYRLVTGQPPEDALDRLLQDRLLQPSDLNPAMPPDLDRMIVKSLTLHPGKRYRSVHAWLRDLPPRHPGRRGHG